MTGNSNKIRAVFLAALMVFSVFAGTVAFSGSAAAAVSGTANGSVTDGNVDRGATETQTFAIDVLGGDGDSVDQNVTFDISGVSVNSVDASSLSVNNSGGGSIVLVDGNTVNVTFADDGSAGDDYAISFDATVDASGVSTGDYSVTADVTDTAGPTEEVSDASVGTITVTPAGGPELESAVHYDNDTSSSRDGEIELAFNEEVGNPTSAISVYDDDTVLTGAVSITQTDPGRVVIDTGTGPNSIRTGDVQVNLDGLTDVAGNPTPDDGNNSVRFAPVPIKTTEEVNAYQGGNVSIVANSTDTSVTVEGASNNYFFEGSTGTNSKVFVFGTEDRELGDYNVSIGGSTAENTQITVRDLGFGATVDDLSVTDDDTIEVDVTANAGNRDIEVEILDSTGDDLNSTEVTTAGDGTATVEFDTATADDGDALDTGDYTVESTDLFSGISVESSTITVETASDEAASFTDNAISEERGDILEFTVELTQTDTATVTFGSADDGVNRTVTIEDENDDDEVTLFLNTYRLDSGVSGDAFNIDSDSDDEITARHTEQSTDDLIDSGDYDLEVESGTPSSVTVGVTESDDVATVTLTERNTETLRMWTGSKAEINGFSDLEDVNEAIADGEITQSSDIAVGDYAVHQLVATGFEGALDAREDEDVSSGFLGLVQNGPVNLTIEEADPGANQDAAELNLSASNVDVIADGENDTYFVIVDTGSSATGFAAPRNESLPSDDDTELETNFTVLQDDAGFDFTNDEEFDDDENEETFVSFTAEEPEVTINGPFNVSQASGQTLSAETNIAPGTEMRLRVRSDDGVSPSFLKTANPVVQSDGSFSSTFDFSQQSVGDSYEITVSSSGIILAEDETEDGQVVESVATATPEPDTDTPEPDTDTPEPDTDTPEPDTDTPEPDTATPEPETEEPTSTPTSTPGFGVVVALTALLAAALLAVRRD